MTCLPAPTSALSSSPSGTDTADRLEPTSKPQPLNFPSSSYALQAIYIAPPDSFPEVEDFVATSATQYHLDLVRYTLPMCPALKVYLSDRTAIKAIFMGTRRTDPHSEFLTHFNPTDNDWPQFMRVNPLIDWHYVEIWAVSIFCLYCSCFLYVLRRRMYAGGRG